MKFMMIVKSAERSGLPPKELMEAIDKLSEEANKSGSMIGGGGLGPTALGARVRLSDGKVTVIDGPFTGGQRDYRRLRPVRVEIQTRSRRKRGEVHGTSQKTLARLGRRNRDSPDVRPRRLRPLQTGIRVTATLRWPFARRARALVLVGVQQRCTPARHDRSFVLPSPAPKSRL